MSVDEMQEIVDTLAARLGRSVAVDDPEIRLIVASRHFGDEDDLRVYSILNRCVPDEARDSALTHGMAHWHGPGRIPGNDHLGYDARVCVPVRCEGEPLGYLWLIDPEDAVMRDHLDAAIDAATRIGELLRVRNHGSTQEQLTRALVSGDPAALADAERRLTFPDHEHPRLVVVAAETRGEHTEQALRTAFDEAARNLPCTATMPDVSGGTGYALVAHRADAQHIDPVAHATAVYAELDRNGVVGVGDVGDGWIAAATLHRQAMEALELCRRRHLPVLGWTDLGADPLLLRIASAEDRPGWPGETLVRHLLGEKGNSTLLETAEAYLDCAGDSREAAARLRVHKTTLYYRLRRIEEVTGLRFASGDDRLALHVAVRMQRLGGLRRQ